MTIQQVDELVNLIKFNIKGQPYQFAAYFAVHWRNFLEPRVNPPFVTTAGLISTSTACFDSNFNGRESQQLSMWRRSPPTRNLMTGQIYYLDRQRHNLQRLVDYWDAQFLPLVVSGSTGSQSGGATLGPGFTRSVEFLKYRHVMTRPGGAPPPQIGLGNNLPPRYQSLRSGVGTLHRRQLRP